MSKFKVGDPVICTKTSYGNGFRKGEKYIVTDVDETQSNWIGVDKDSNGERNGWVAKNFELIEEEPFIITIPPQPAKRVLKDYEFITENRARVKLIAEGRTVSLDTNNYSFEAVDIAELITFLTKVHEVLKENENDA